MPAINEILSVENPVFRSYMFYGSVLVVKMLVMSLLTARQRIKNKAFANPEDAELNKVKVKVHEDVERVRRAHLNDVENILPYFLVSFGYLLTNPAPFVAIWLFRVYTAARFAHTLVYAVAVVPQPARGISWFAGYLITGYMAFRTITYFA
ncbi:microsomal glutathione S-transferase 1 [Agrilus planipennis]|uniref:Microsomal glutathione S-transferase 1 n=1 Tax=Agrilus planipennis TaxID=224129 RepID=A0A1W4XLK0_AGRPL|nr:microsomal glutathione S-transferase 1 [Agrilus planipennis]